MKELTVEGLKEGKEKAINLALSQIERVRFFPQA